MNPSFSILPAVFSLAIAVAALLVPATACAQFKERHTIKSHAKGNPEVPFDLLLPSGDGPFPAMVQVHGSGGPNITLMHNYYGRQLNQMGVAVTVANHFEGRGVKSTVQGQGAVTHLEVMMDSFKILEWLSKHPKIDAKRIGIFGYSKGGTVSFYSAFTEMADWMLPDGPRFGLHVAFYPGCVNNHWNVKTTGAPLLVLLGEADDWANPKACIRLVDRVRERGSPVEMVMYPGARHSWDSAWDPYNDPRGENYFNCILDEREDGSIVELHTGIQIAGKGGSEDSSARARAINGCRTYGIGGGPNREVREQSTKALLDIVAETFSLRR